MLEDESNQQRIQDIEQQITSCQEDIAELQNGKPLFGKPKPLIRETKIIEADPEKKGEQKITVINPKPEISTTKPSDNKIGNSLRNNLKNKISSNDGNELKAKVQEIKRSRAKFS